jgi:hypothetical protein
MAIITKGAVNKNEVSAFTLNKSELLQLVESVVEDTYFADPTNWKRVRVCYTSSEGNQREVVVFDATQAVPTGEFFISDKAKDEFLVRKLVIEDFDGGWLDIFRDELNAAEFDIVLASISSFVNWNIQDPLQTIAYGSEGGLQAIGFSNPNTSSGQALSGDFILTYGIVRYGSFLFGVPYFGYSKSPVSIGDSTPDTYINTFSTTGLTTGAGFSGYFVEILTANNVYELKLTRTSGIITYAFINVTNGNAVLWSGNVESFSGDIYPHINLGDAFRLEYAKLG